MNKNLIFNLIQQQNYLSSSWGVSGVSNLITSFWSFNEVMRLVYSLSSRATEVVLLRKLGGNEVRMVMI